jgi:hypothetical protein
VEQVDPNDTEVGNENGTEDEDLTAVSTGVSVVIGRGDVVAVG